MTQIATLDYAAPSPSTRKRVAGLAATALLLYPILLAVALYGPWFLAWSVLGHPPRPLIDDPAYLGSTWARSAMSILVLGAAPAGCAAIALNALYLTWHGSIAARMRVTVRLAALIVPWLVLFALFHWDPGSVFTWWAD